MSDERSPHSELLLAEIRRGLIEMTDMPEAFDAFLKIERHVRNLEEQLEAYRKALDEIAHWPGSWSGETAIMLRDHARVALDSNPASTPEAT